MVNKRWKQSKSPRTATRLEQIIQLKTDNCNVKEGWIIIDGGQVTLCNQVLGEKSTGSVTFSRRAFNRLIDWYNREQLAASQTLVQELKDARDHAATAMNEYVQEVSSEIATLQATLAERERECSDYRKRKDEAYSERNRVVAALAKLFPSGIARTNIEGWDEEWHGCVYIDLPWGQVSWHYHDSQADLFKDLPPYTKPWDGHDTDEKYHRLNMLVPSQAEQQVARLREAFGALDRLISAHKIQDLDAHAIIADALRETGAGKEDATVTAHRVGCATAEQIEQYIRMADAELGPECVDAWVEDIRQFLRTRYNTR